MGQVTTTRDFLIPDTTRLAEYNAVFTIDDMAKNLSQKYRQFATEIRKILETLLRQNSFSEDQIDLRLANKFLLDERDILNKFLNDESFSPDLDILVATETEKVISELGNISNATRKKITEIGETIKSLFETAEETLKKNAFEDMATGKQQPAMQPVQPQATAPSGLFSFTSFDGIRYFTGWLTSSFMTKLQTVQTEMFGGINESVLAIQNFITDDKTGDVVTNALNAKTDKMMSEGVLNAESGKLHELMFLDLVTLNAKKSLRRSTRNAVLGSYHLIVDGFKNIVVGLGSQIGKLGLGVAQKTFDAAGKTLSKISSMFKWTFGKVVTHSILWGSALYLLWKVWLKDRFKDTIVTWISNFVKDIKNKVPFMDMIGAVFNVIKTYFYDKYLAKFVNWFDKTWGPRVNNLRTFLKNKVLAVVNWAKGWIEKVRPTYDAVHDKSVVVGNWIEGAWNFVVEHAVGKLKKPFDIVKNGVKDLFNDIKSVGDWLWGFVKGKKSWKDTRSEFLENVWHPAVTRLHDTTHAIIDFAAVNGNWILDFVGAPTSYPRFERATSDDPTQGIGKSVFEHVFDSIGTWFRTDHVVEIPLDDGENGVKLSITPRSHFEGGFESGFDLTFVHGEQKIELDIPGAKTATLVLEKLAEDARGFIDAAAQYGGMLVGGFAGAWIGRIVGLLISAFAAIGTGGLTLAAAGTAWDIGGTIGSILGSVIGYFFTRSLTESKSYFNSPARENVMETMGASREAVEALDTTWTVENVRKMTGVDFGLKNVGTPLRSVSVNQMKDEDRELFDTMGFQNAVYQNFNKAFNLTVGTPTDPFQVKNQRMAKNLIVGDNESYLEHFDKGVDDIENVKVTFGRYNFNLLDYLNKSNMRHTGVPLEWKNPEALFRKLTSSGNEWTNMMLGYMNVDPGANPPLNILESLRYAISQNKMVGTFTSDRDGKTYYSAVPLVQRIISGRFGLDLFQYAVQKSIQGVVQLFTRSSEGELNGEQEFIRNVSRLLLHTVFIRDDENGYRRLAREINGEIFKNWFAGDLKNKGVGERSRELFEKLYKAIKNMEGTDGLREMYSMGWSTRIKNILDTISKYTYLIVHNEGLGVGDDRLTRRQISELFEANPNLIGTILSSGEIGQAFKNKDGLPTDKLDSAERTRRLIDLFGLVNNSDLQRLNEQLTEAMDDFDKAMTEGEDGRRVREQLRVLLNQVQNSGWQEKIRTRIKNGLISEKQFNDLIKKYDNLLEQLKKNKAVYFENNAWIVVQPQETLGEKETNEI